MEKPLLQGIRKGCYTFLLVILGPIILQIGIFAQEAEASKASFELNFGFKVGATMSSFTNQQPHSNMIAGLSAGGFVSYPFHENMEVQLEAFYSQEGGRLLTFDLPYLIDQDYWYDLKAKNQRIVLNMLNIPILYKYNLAVGDAKLSFHIGPNFGFLLKANSQQETTIFTESGSFHTYTETEDITSNIKKYSYSAVVGLGAEIPIDKYTLFIEGRYKHGFSKIYESYSYVGIPQITGDLKCHTVIISLGFAF